MTSVRPRPDTTPGRTPEAPRAFARGVGLLALLAALAVAVLAGLAVGARTIPPLEVIRFLLFEATG